MTDEKKPNALEDVSKGLGLLFRAAKTTVERLPTEKIEDLVSEGAKEVGRAIEAVSDVIERDVLGKKPASGPPPADAAKPGDHATAETTTAAKDASAPNAPNAPNASDAAPSKTDDDPPKGPRVV